ncbi:MAG: hypothetical protein M9894_34605 [Planctomycetes bacterium]|nr:hypothetical protein [Planctomycetota bacterium]
MLAILRKDLSEQSHLLAPACLLALVGLVVFTSRGPIQADPMLAAFDAFVLLCAAPLALLLVRQLVVVEYVRRGFDALEPLPVSQAGVLGAKALVGLALLAGVVLAGATMTASALRLVTEQPPPPAALAARAMAFLLAVHGAAFLAATTGRHRHAVALAAAAALGGAARTGLVDLERLGPVALARGGFWSVDGPFDPPALEAAGLGLGALALAFVLGCARRGRLARAWSGPWRAGDAARALALALAAGAVWADERWAQRPPVRLEGAVEAVGAVSVRVPAPDQAARAAEVAALAATLLDDLARRSGVAAPPVAVEVGAGLPPTTTERLDPGAARGLLLRAAFTDPAWDAGAFAAALLEEATDALPLAAPGLARDGYPTWRAQRAAPALAPAARLEAAWALEALGGAPPLGAWSSVAERVGPRAARALSAWVLERLEASRGEEAVDALVAAALRGRAPPRAPLDAAFEAALGAAAAALTATLAAELARLPRPAAIVVEAEPDGALRFSAAPGREREAGLPCALLHGLDGPREPLRRDEALVGGPPGRTLARYPAGAVVRCGLAVPAPVVGGELVVAWRRLVVGEAGGGGP